MSGIFTGPLCDTGLRYLPPIPHNKDMDNDFIATLIPLSVIVCGFEYICGHPLLTMLNTYFSQIGL